jgi:hypothetical protein
VEGVGLGRIFSLRLNRSSWQVWYLANLASTALAFASVLANFDTELKYKPFLLW